MKARDLNGASYFSMVLRQTRKTARSLRQKARSRVILSFNLIGLQREAKCYLTENVLVAWVHRSCFFGGEELMCK